MTNPVETEGLQGLAASISRLFDAEDSAPVVDMPSEEPEADGGDVAWVAESGVRLPGDVNAPDPLIEAVRTFLRAEEHDRDAARGAVEAAVEDARERRAGASLADSAEALALMSENVPGARELAAAMTTPGVATLLMERFVSTPVVERRRELLRCLPDLGEEMGFAVHEALRTEALDADSDRKLRRQLIELASAVGIRHPSVIAEMVQDPNWRVVRNAVHALAEQEASQALPHLTVALGHERPEVRREALNALSQHGGEDAVALVMGTLEDSDPGVRSQAARALGMMNADRALRPMIQRLEKESEGSVQLELIRSLGILGDPSAVLSIEKRISGSLFSRPPTELRVVGYRALASIGTPHAMGLIEKAASDKDVEVQRVASSLVEERARPS